jgi:hypothetical protein
VSTIDVSRWATDHRKRYSGVRMQQGRVLTDDDFNEAERLDAEDIRVTRVHVVGESGSPDAGFQVQAPGVSPNPPNALTFQIAAGTLYLGGLRLEASAAEAFEEQKDWLPFMQAANGIPPVAAGTTRIDMVWIEAVQQNVSAVEDSELLEKALGGPDTAQRMRPMRRVRVSPGVGAADCGGAWSALVAGWAAAGEGTLGPDLEMRTNAVMTVTPVAAPPGNLCTPAVAGGYLGAENQAIRVQINGANTFTWGFDNASPLYRVLIKTDPDPASPTSGLRVVLELQTEPKDTVHWPRAGQLIELLAWSAALPNREKIAELSGLYGRVVKSYDPVTKQIYITPEAGAQVPAGFEDVWAARPAADVATFYDGSAAGKYAFMRVWNRGDEAAPVARIPILGGGNTLGNTGLQVQFGGGPRRNNDFWIIAARPETPDLVVPWVLKNQAPPIGLKRYRAPLGLIRWTATGAGVVTGEVIHDCRHPFLPLTKVRGCCTVTVGDGTHSFGQFTTIQAAIAALPPEGGEICVREGIYDENVLINGRVGIKIHGCGPRTRIRAAAPGGAPQPAFLIARSSAIAIENMAIESGPLSAVHISNSRNVTVKGCVVQMRDLTTLWPAIFSRGDDILIQGNIVEVLPANGIPPAPTVPAALPDADAPAGVYTPAPAVVIAGSTRGGIQLAGGSDRVRVVDNTIRGGIWNGITLGSLMLEGSDGTVDTPDDPTLRDPCFPCRPGDHTEPENPPPGRKFVSAGDLTEIVIAHNRITDMGMCGISVVRFFDLTAGGDLIGVYGLRITDNLITRCMRRDVAQPRDAMQWLVAYGGITLAIASDLRILRNDIVHNGRNHLDPIVGVYAILVMGLQIDENRIIGNGTRDDERVDGAKQGIRGGVHVWFALPSIGNAQGSLEPSLFKRAPRLFGSVQACAIRDNVIEAPLGRAVTFLSLGHVVVARNRLVTLGTTGRGLDLLAATVLIGNFGFSNEWTEDLIRMLGEDVVGGANRPDPCRDAKRGVFSAIDGRLARPLVHWWASGKTLFTENQVTLDLMDDPFGFGLTSMLIFSLDDCRVNDNQVELSTTQTFYGADMLLFGGSVHEADNRLSETIMHVWLSSLSIGAMNTTTDNQATHCLLALAADPSLRMFRHNLALINWFCPGICGGTGYGEE